MADKKTDVIAYCGAYCGECANYTKAIVNPAKELAGELRRSRCDKAAEALGKIKAFKAFRHYDKFCELLKLMTKLECKDVCKRGGGSSQCKIKRCAIKKGLEGCWQCDEFQRCKTLKLLEKYGDTDKTYLKNLLKIRRQGTSAFIQAKSR